MITANGLTKYYGDACAISGIDFDIAEGEIVGLLGLNGAGKTTTLKVLACLLLPSAGRVQVKGLDVTESPHEVRKLVGFLPESPPLYTEMTVDDFLIFCGQLRGLSHDGTLARLGEVTRLTGLSAVRQQVIATLSHGYRQRVGIAQAIIHDPDLLILDEPIKGLDPAQIVEIREMIRGLRGRHTIILSSHILSEISQTCDRIFVIKDGQLAAQGTEEELVLRMAHGHRLQLLVRGDKDEALTLLQKNPKITRCVASSGTSYSHRRNEEQGLQLFEVTTEDDQREAIASALIAAGFGLLQLSPAEDELESAFLRLSGDPTATDAPPRRAPTDAAPDDTAATTAEGASHA